MSPPAVPCRGVTSRSGKSVYRVFCRVCQRPHRPHVLAKPCVSTSSTQLDGSLAGMSTEGVEINGGSSAAPVPPPNHHGFRYQRHFLHWRQDDDVFLSFF